MYRVSCLILTQHSKQTTQHVMQEGRFCQRIVPVIWPYCSADVEILFCSFFHLRHTEIGEEDAKNILLISQVANTCSC